MEVSGQLHVPAALLPVKYARYPMHKRLVGTGVGLNAEAKRKNPCPYREPKSDNPAHSLVIILTTYPGKGKVKLSLCFFLTEHHAMKAYWGSGGIASLVL
jgi:hypothetical protein